MTSPGIVLSVASAEAHGFSKQVRGEIRLLPGLGVEGDAHCGSTVQHLSRRAITPDAPNLRQLHLLQSELLEELAAAGFKVGPGVMGENVTTKDFDLLALPRGARIRLGPEAVVEITGLRNPCRQIDLNVGMGAMAAVLGKASDGSLVRRAGVMAVVLSAGVIRAGDPIAVEGMPAIAEPLAPV